MLSRQFALGCAAGLVCWITSAAQATQLEAGATARSLQLNDNFASVPSFNWSNMALASNGDFWLRRSGLGGVTRVTSAGVVTDYSLTGVNGNGDAIEAFGDWLFIANRQPNPNRIQRLSISDLLASTDQTSRDAAVSDTTDFDVTTNNTSWAMEVVPNGFKSGHANDVLFGDGDDLLFMDPNTGNTTAFLSNIGSGTISGLGFSPDGSTLFVADTAGEIFTYDGTGTGGAASFSTTIYSGLDVNPVTGEVIVTSSNGQIYALPSDLSTATLLATDAFNSWPNGSVFSADGDRLYFADGREHEVQYIAGFLNGVSPPPPETPAPAGFALLLAGLGCLVRFRRQ